MVREVHENKLSKILELYLQCFGKTRGYHFRRFCYQKLILDDETAPALVYQGLNGVYIKELKKETSEK